MQSSSIRTICSLIWFMALLGAIAPPVAAAPPKLRLEAFLFPDNVLVNSQDRTLAFCLLNHGQANDLIRQGEDDDRLVLTIRRGDADADLAAQANVPGCTPSDPLWDCTVDDSSPEELVLTVGPPLGGSVTVSPSQTICFSISELNVNSAQGLSFLALEQHIDSKRAQGLEERPLAVFKSRNGVIRHDDLEGVEPDQHHPQTWELSGNDIFPLYSGNVGIGTSDPMYPLHVAAPRAGLSAFFEGSGMFSQSLGIGTTPRHALDVVAPPKMFAGYFQGKGYFRNNLGIGTDDPLYRLHVRASAGSFAGFFEGRGYFSERLGIGTQAADAMLHVVSSADEPLLTLEQQGSGRGARIAMNSTANSNPALEVVNLGTGKAIQVTGTISTDVLEIRGADLAEKFPVSEAVAPGMVVAIDPDRPGRLQISRRAYDQRVAGVVSGAGDLPAGAILGHLPESKDAPPVALTGRVWVYCDASQQPIAPGDLLTTSDTAGHAMKVVDRARAHGAVLGKAMTSLDRGRGLVLALLSLQ